MPYYDDDGNELDPSTISKPELCCSCKNDGKDPEEEVLCNLTRLDQKDDEEFRCEAFEKIDA